jgi:hypothetical protein
MHALEVVLFPPLRFEKFNETDVREEIIAPLLCQLGYMTGTDNNIIREQSLRYPKSSLGRKDQKKDPELRGKADYILEVGNRLRWVIEAKAPEVEIDDLDAIEQAWTYASHPEIRAIYYALCNGRTLLVFRTVHGPKAAAIFALPYEEFDGRFQSLINLLSPEALTLSFPDAKIDEGRPLAPGLRSVTRITNGIIRYEHNSLDLPLLDELQVWITDGAVERDETTGKLIAFLKTNIGTRSLQELNERLGIAEFEMLSEDAELSTDSSCPTVFWYRGTIALAAGEEIFNLATWQRVKLLQNVTCDIVSKGQGVYRERSFSGVFESFTRYHEVGLVLTLSGSFEIHLA